MREPQIGDIRQMVAGDVTTPGAIPFILVGKDWIFPDRFWIVQNLIGAVSRKSVEDVNDSVLQDE